MANEVRVRATVDDKVSGSLDRIKDKFQLLGKTAAGGSLLGNLGAMGVAKGLDMVSSSLGGVVDQAFKSIDAASNLNEAMSKSDAVFGDSSDAMAAWADGAAEAFGQSKRQALEAAGTFGNLIQAFGIGSDKAATMSKTLVELASDLASFNNTSVDEAILALRSGLSGETEPLKRYGVALNDVRLKEEALRLGLIKTTSGVLPITIKTQAAYSLILKDTALAQGDFDRTSDGLANTQKSLQAAIEDVQAEIGQELLPVMLELANFAKDDLVPAISGVVDFLKESGDEFTALAEIVQIFATQGMNGMSLWSEHTEREAAKAREAVKTATEDIVGAVKARHGEYGQATEDLAEELPENLQDAKTEAVAIVSTTPQALADALRDGRDKWQEAIDLFNQDWEDKLSTAAEIGKLKGFLAGDKLAKGLNSADPILRAQAYATQQTVISRLQELTGKTYDIGKNTLLNYVKGMTSQMLAVEAAAERAAAIVSDNLRVRSPAKEGPLSEGGGPEGFGRKFIDLYAEGVRDGMPKIGATVADLAGAMVGGAGREPSTVAGGGNVYNLTVNVDAPGILSPAQGQALAREVGPFLMDYIQRRG
jgi:hypothetical protein